MPDYKSMMGMADYGKYKDPSQAFKPAKRTPKNKMQKYDPSRSGKLIAVGPPKKRRKRK